MQPKDVGQAGRIGGVNPADISNLLIHLEVIRRRGNVRALALAVSVPCISTIGTCAFTSLFDECG